MNDNDTIQRCPHDEENPYAQINRDLIRDSSISPECRWLLIFLLSNSPNFVIRQQHIINHTKGFKGWGRDNVRKTISEAIEAGYMRKETQMVGNLKQGNKYYVSERPKFKKSLPLAQNVDAVEIPLNSEELKKSFRRTEFQSTENRSAENTSLKEEQGIKKEQTNKEPVVDALSESLKKSLKEPGQVERALKYYESHKEELQKKAHTNPIGLLVSIIRNNLDKGVEEVEEIVRKRKEYAKGIKNKSAPCGYLEILEEGILKTSGALSTMIKWAGNHSFWDNVGLPWPVRA